MRTIQVGLLTSALLAAGVSSATALSAKGLHPQEVLRPADKGKVETNYHFYTCPDLDTCAVKITVRAPEAGGNVCRFSLTGDDGQEFFYIDRNINRDKQTIEWTLVAGDQGSTASFTKRSTVRSEGIHVTEGSQHVIERTGSTGVQRRRITRSITNRRSILLYDIDVTLSRGAQTIACKPFGPAILNRGN